MWQKLLNLATCSFLFLPTLTNGTVSFLVEFIVTPLLTFDWFQKINKKPTFCVSIMINPNNLYLNYVQLQISVSILPETCKFIAKQAGASLITSSM